MVFLRKLGGIPHTPRKAGLRSLFFQCHTGQKIRNTAEERALTKAIEMDAIEGGYHATLMKDPVSGKVIRRSSYREPAPAEDTAEEILEDPELPAEKTENDEKGAE